MPVGSLSYLYVIYVSYAEKILEATAIVNDLQERVGRASLKNQRQRLACEVFPTLTGRCVETPRRFVKTSCCAAASDRRTPLISGSQTLSPIAGSILRRFLYTASLEAGAVR